MILKKRVGVAILCLLLAGCAKQQPGRFSQIDRDPVAHTYQFRYQPQKLDSRALDRYIRERCSHEGFDSVDRLPEEEATLPGYKTRWYQCNYSIKH